MTFENREPTKTDYEHLEVHEITGSQRWNPQRFYDGSEAMSPLLENIIQGFMSSTKSSGEVGQEKGEDPESNKKGEDIQYAKRKCTQLRMDKGSGKE